MVILVPVVGDSVAGIGLLTELFGVLSGAMNPLQSGVWVERFGPARLQTALSLSGFFYGIPSFLAIPLAGKIWHYH